ncbi:class I SAM-dependent methyltransferase [Flavimarina sp. Hel_I_48]|uniref:class I SAM-dependent methyltransferase n=1 Tax=Flavimarina sp. Hel_I_48 TaxID=1392488 RepID=UPI00068A7805|nr:class I SAM-dependent methyltransferase [Flavimarina sp. Hel_I_48]
MLESNNAQEYTLEKVWNENNSNWHDGTYLQPIIPIISEYLNGQRSNRSLLDFGCGFGRLSNIFDKYGFEVVGIDSSQERIEKATLDYPSVHFEHFLFVNTLPFEDNSFDIIFANSVLQYVNHQDFLKESNRILREGGSVIFIENLKKNPITGLGRFFLKITKHKYQSYPWNHFTFKELSALKDHFNYSRFEIFHIVSPAAYLKVIRKFYPYFHKLDTLLLKRNFFKQYAWLGVFIGQKK